MPFVLDRFLKSRRLTLKELAEASGIDRPNLVRMKDGKRGANVAHIEKLVEGARVLLRDKSITADDFICVPGGEEGVSRKGRGTVPKRWGPYGKVEGETIQEIIQGYTGKNGEHIVPLIVAIAQDQVYEEADDGTGKKKKTRIPMKAQEQMSAAKWLTEHGGFGKDSGQDLSVVIVLQDEAENLVGRHPVVWKGHIDSSPPVPSEGVSEALLAGAVSGGEDAVGAGVS